MARPTTEHYGIPEYGPQGTGDPMGVYSVYNPAMVIIDKILFDLKGLIDALEDRMDKVEDRLDNAEDNITNIKQDITEMGNKYDAAIQDILNKIYGGGTVGEDGHVNWGDSGTIPTGNMSVFGNSGMTSYIRTRAGVGADDVRVN